MESHGGNVELLGIEDGVARLRLEGSCHGCAASASTLELAIEQALQATAPDLEGIDVEGVWSRRLRRRFELPMAGGGAPVSGWQALDGLDGSPAPGALAPATALVVANVAGDLLAYRNRCAGCGGALDDGDLSGGTLICPTCAREFDLPRAGPLARGRACSSARCRCCATATPCGSRWHEGGPAGPRHQPPPAPPGRAAAAAPRRHGGRRAVRAVHADAPAEAPAPAAPRRAADPVRVRDLLGGALRRRRVPPRRQPHAVARRLRALRRAVGVVPDPDRARVPHGQSTVSGGVVGLYPSPAGATECELDLEAWAARCAPTTRRWRRSSPTPRRWSSTAWPTRRST